MVGWSGDVQLHCMQLTCSAAPASSLTDFIVGRRWDMTSGSSQGVGRPTRGVSEPGFGSIPLASSKSPQGHRHTASKWSPVGALNIVRPWLPLAPNFERATGGLVIGGKPRSGLAIHEWELPSSSAGSWTLVVSTGAMCSIVGTTRWLRILPYYTDHTRDVNTTTDSTCHVYCSPSIPCFHQRTLWYIIAAPRHDCTERVLALQWQLELCHSTLGKLLMCCLTLAMSSLLILLTGVCLPRLSSPTNAPVFPGLSIALSLGPWPIFRVFRKNFVQTRSSFPFMANE